MDNILAKKTMLEAFRQKRRPTMFLSGFFRSRPEYIFDTDTVEIDIKRNDEAVAVDVVKYTIGNRNKNKRL